MGFIQLLSLQFPGKKRMQVAELLNGITFSDEAKSIKLSKTGVST